MITNENKKLAQWAMEYALKNGCQSSRVTLYNGSSSSFEIRDMKIDRLQQASENSMISLIWSWSFRVNTGSSFIFTIMNNCPSGKSGSFYI